MTITGYFYASGERLLLVVEIETQAMMNTATFTQILWLDDVLVLLLSPAPINEYDVLMTEIENWLTERVGKKEAPTMGSV